MGAAIRDRIIREVSVRVGAAHNLKAKVIRVGTLHDSLISIRSV